MGKILLVVSIVFTLASAGLGFVNRGKLVETKATLDSTAKSLEETKGTLATTEGQLKTTGDQLTTVTSEKAIVDQQLTSTKEDLTKANNQVTELTTQVGDKETQVAQLNSEIEELKKNAPPSGDSPVVNEQVAQLTAAVAEKETLVNKLQSDMETSRVQLEEFRKRDEERRSRLMRKGLEGKILAVNNAWNFVVLNLGDRNGVVNNAEMLIKRGTQLIGKIRVTSVEPSTSIADIVSSSVPGEISIQPGDQVIAQTVED